MNNLLLNQFERMGRWVLYFCVCWPGWVIADTYFAWATRVSDGDTLWVRQDNSQSTRKLRLLDMDAPELCQSGGVASREALRQWVQGRRLRVTVKFQDIYGRDLAQVHADGQNVNAQMVQQGQAWAGRWHGKIGAYAVQETQARAKRLGVFAQPNPELPSDFRKRHGSCFFGR
jgi:micrococcal nuclease